MLVCTHLLGSHNSVKRGKTTFLLVFTIPIFTQDQIQVRKDKLRGAARRAPRGDGFLCSSELRPQLPSPPAALGSCCVTWLPMVSVGFFLCRTHEESFPEPDWDPFHVSLPLALSAFSGFPDPILILTQGYDLHVKLLHAAGFWFIHLWSGFQSSMFSSSLTLPVQTPHPLKRQSPYNLLPSSFRLSSCPT